MSTPEQGPAGLSVPEVAPLPTDPGDLLTNPDDAAGCVPDLALITRLANELFHGPPGPVEPGPSGPGGVPALVSVSEAVVPPSVPPVQTQLGTAPSEPVSPVPVPTDAELGGIPAAFDAAMGFVVSVPLVEAPSGPAAAGVNPFDTNPFELLVPSVVDAEALVPNVVDQSFADPGPVGPGAVPIGGGGRAAPGAPEPLSLDLGSLAAWPARVPDLGARPGPFDPHVLRRDFPILQQQVNGRPLVWLDNGATTQKPQVVIDRITHFYQHENSNVHRGAHALAARATDAYEGARATVQRFVNAGSADEIVFVRGTTEAINLVAKSWGAKHIGEGDEVVITWLEHHANIVPWQQLCAEQGAVLRVAPVDDTGQVILSEYQRLVGPRTKLVAFTQVSNSLGTVTPAAEMVEIAHRRGARVLIDGAQAAAHLRVDVQALGCDFFVFSGHKVFGPTGIGVVYGKGEVLEDTPPWQGGGNMIADVTFDRTVYQPPPYRFEAGTGNIADAVGLGTALDYVSAVGIDQITRYEHQLLAYALDGLGRVPGIRLFGTATEKADVLSFVLDGFRTEDVGKALDQQGIAVRAGHHCAQPSLRRFGVESTVRASLALYNTSEDIDALVDGLLRIQARRV